MRKRDIERNFKQLQRNLAEQTKTRRGEEGQREFARRTGFDQGALSRIENRKLQRIGLTTVVKLAGALGCEPVDLLQPVEQ